MLRAVLGASSIAVGAYNIDGFIGDSSRKSGEWAVALIIS